MESDNMDYLENISGFDEFDPVFEETIVRSLSNWPGPADVGVKIPVDVQEVYGGWEIQANLPGVSPEDVFITVVGCHLKIQGIVRAHEANPPTGTYFKEREVGKFYRSIALPEQVDPSSIYTCFENGVLKIRLEQ